tara:strand:+ start:957 stop:1364 length:408 start_codon:yes stop_codon:yes gene_type:complete
MVNYDKIDKELGILETINPQEILPYDKTKDIVSSEEDIDDDYKYQRENFYNLVDKGSAAIDGILELAKESEHPRTYEVAGQLIKTVAEVTEKLGDLQEKMKKLKEVPDSAPKTVTNALFVGSTTELQKLLKNKDK